MNASNQTYYMYNMLHKLACMHNALGDKPTMCVGPPKAIALGPPTVYEPSQENVENVL